MCCIQHIWISYNFNIISLTKRKISQSFLYLNFFLFPKCKYLKIHNFKMLNIFRGSSYSTELDIEKLPLPITHLTVRFYYPSVMTRFTCRRAQPLKEVFSSTNCMHGVLLHGTLKVWHETVFHNMCVLVQCYRIEHSIYMVVLCVTLSWF